MKEAGVVAIRNREGRAVWLSATELALYRGATLGLLRRYFSLSVEIGRLPSLLGRECFRAHLTSYRAQSFEDAVIFVHDLERCLEKLDEFSQQLIARVVFQEYTREEAAKLLGCTRKTVYFCYSEALDCLSALLLMRGLMQLLPLHAQAAAVGGTPSQGVRGVQMSASSSNDTK